MPRVKVVIDSTTFLPENFHQYLSVEMIPLYVI